MIKLRDFIKAADAGTVGIFNKLGRVLPFYHIITKDKEQLLIPSIALPDGKDEALMAIRDLMEAKDAIGYVFITEAWAVSGEAVDDKLKEYAKHNSLEGYPGRKEILLYAAESIEEGMLMADREIIRMNDGPPKLAELNFQEGDKIEGRMVGLLNYKGMAS